MIEILKNILSGITLAAPLGPASIAIMQNGFQSGFKRALFYRDLDYHGRYDLPDACFLRPLLIS